jgi:hypothetical protein
MSSYAEMSFGGPKKRRNKEINYLKLNKIL